MTLPSAPELPPLPVLAARIAALLRARGQTVAVSESSASGLASAALLAIPGASNYFLGGAVVYTRRAGKVLLGVTEADVKGMRPETEPYAAFVAARMRDQLGATWGLGETGAAGPTGSRYGDAPGHVCVAVAGPAERVHTLETGLDDRPANMELFARALLQLFEEALLAQPEG